MMTTATERYRCITLIVTLTSVFCAALANLILNPFLVGSNGTLIKYRKSTMSRSGTGNSSLCGDGLCVCDHYVANCSGRGLRYVPSLPSNITTLYLDSNNITSIAREDFFNNVSFIQYIFLRSNGLRTLNPKAFQIFTRRPLHLTLDDNLQLNYTGLLPVLGITVLKMLSCINCGLGEIPRGFFNRSSLSMRVLYLSGNNLGVVKMTDFQTVQLHQLHLDMCKICHLTVDNVSHVLLLSLRQNSLAEFPKTCQENNQSLFPNLKKLVLSQNSLDSVPDRVCLPWLESLDLSQNRFVAILSNTFNLNKFPMLRSLHFSKMIMYQLKMTISKFAFNNSALVNLNLDGNNLRFNNADLIQKYALRMCPSLTNLTLDNNFFSYGNMSDHRFIDLFGRLQVHYLSMKNTYLSKINAPMLSHFKHLQMLELDQNKLNMIPEGTFDGLTELKYLSLQDNLLTIILPSTFGVALRNSLKKLDLGFNPLECSCQMLWFQSWMQTRPDQFPNSQKRYECHNDKAQSVYSFVLNPQACILSHQMYQFITIFSTFSLLVFTLSVLTYRYRWHLRLVMYEAFRGRSDVRRRRLLTGNFQYDIFVSYDSEDLGWVTGHLMLHLEQRLGLRLCVHQRDFVVGKYIVDNIADSVERSKMVMMVFSNSFAKSQWCQFELSLCLHHVMDHGDDLLIVCLGDVVSRDLSSAMMAVLKTTTYIQWVGTEPDAVRAFWGRLEIALRDIIAYRHA